MASRRTWLRRAALVALTMLAVLVAAWHASPVALWHGRFAAQLAREGDAARLRSPTWSALPPPPRAWAELRIGAIALRAPLALEALPACGRCAGACRLPLDNRGTLAILDEPPPAGHGEVYDQFAPDAGDISLARPVWRNWRTIDALTDRVRSGSVPTRSFRFEAAESRGVVSQYRVDGVDRWVIYPYSRGGTAARVVGVAGLGRERFEGLLGSLRVEPEHRERGASCSTEGHAKATGKG